MTLPKPHSDREAVAQDPVSFDEDSIVEMLDEFVEQSLARATRPPSIRPTHDPGANAAHRTIVSQARNQSLVPRRMAERHSGRRRIELCSALAQNEQGSAKSRLLTTAAELHEGEGRNTESKLILEEALAADARDVVVLRALRKHAIRQRDWKRAVALLEQEASLPLGVQDRARCQTLLAEIYSTQLSDPAAAEHAARKALQGEPNNCTALLLLARIAQQRNDATTTTESLVRLAERWDDEPRVQAELIADAAAKAEHRRDFAGAASLYDRAVQLDRTLWTAWLGSARTYRALGNITRALEALRACGDHAPTASLRDSLAAWHAIWVAYLAPGHLDVRRPGTGTNAAVAAVVVANHDFDRETRALALAELYGGAHGSERGWIAASLAHHAATRGDAGLAKKWAREAVLAAPNLSFAHAIRQVVATSSVTEQEHEAADVGADPMQTAVELAAQKAALERELEALRVAFDEQDAPLACELIGSDAAAALGQTEPLVDSLKRRVDRTSGAKQDGALLALANISDTSEGAAYAKEAARRIQGQLSALTGPEDAMSDPAALTGTLPLDEAAFARWFANTDAEHQDISTLDQAYEATSNSHDALLCAFASWSEGDVTRASQMLRIARKAATDEPSLSALADRSHFISKEHTLAADGAMQTIRDAPSDDEEVLGLAQLYWVDRYGRSDMRNARLSLYAIEQRGAESPFVARARAHHAMHANDVLALGHLGAVGFVRGATASEPLQMVDGAWLGLESVPARAPALRRMLGAAHRAGNVNKVASVLGAFEEQWSGAEKAALQLERARFLQHAHRNEEALDALAAAKSEHPLGSAAHARLLRQQQQWLPAAQGFADAAEQAADPKRGAALWYSAAILYEERLGDLQAALAAYRFAATKDVTYLDLFRRLSELFKKSGDVDALFDLVGARIEAGGDAHTLAELHVRHAILSHDRGDLIGADLSLQRALKQDPKNIEALRQQVALREVKHDWVAAAETLIRIARSRDDAREQRWAFLKLGDIYQNELADPERALSAYRKALALFPRDFETRDRLARACSATGSPAEAVSLLDDLIDRAQDDTSERQFRIRRACALEALGDIRGAEVSLENLRQEHPVQPATIDAMAEFYERQELDAALAVHLTRAATDVRDALLQNPGLATHWQTLCSVTSRRFGPAAASSVAKTADAMGVASTAISSFLRASVDADRGSFSFRTETTALATPDSFGDALLRFFGIGHRGFDKVLPFDESSWGGRRPKKSEEPLQSDALVGARLFGLENAKIRITDAAPLICVPVRSAPFTVLVGSALQELTSSDERLFLFARAASLAALHLESVLRVDASESERVLRSVLLGMAGQASDDTDAAVTKRFLKSLPRSARKAAKELAVEALGTSPQDRALSPAAVASLGNRLALLATGNIEAATTALLKLAGTVPSEVLHRGRMIVDTPEAWRLVQYAMSDRYVEARKSAGMDAD